MNTAGKYRAERDPQVHDRSPLRAGQRAEDRSETRDVQELYQKQLPLRHDNIIDAVIDGDGRRLAVVRAEGPVHQLAVRKISDDQDGKAQQKTNHNSIPLLGSMSAYGGLPLISEP